MDSLISQRFSSFDSQRNMNIEVDIEAFTNYQVWILKWALKSFSRSPGSTDTSSTLVCGNVIFTLTKNITSFFKTHRATVKNVQNLQHQKKWRIVSLALKIKLQIFEMEFLKWCMWANGRVGTFKGWLVFIIDKHNNGVLLYPFSVGKIISMK